MEDYKCVFLVPLIGNAVETRDPPEDRVWREENWLASIIVFHKGTVCFETNVFLRLEATLYRFYTAEWSRRWDIDVEIL